MPHGREVPTSPGLWLYVSSGDTDVSVPVPSDDEASAVVAWMKGNIDEDFTWFLNRLCRRDDGETVVSEPVTWVADGQGEDRWEAAWLLKTETGVEFKACVWIAPTQEDLVVLQVQNRVIGQIIPPWVEHRKRGEEISAKTHHIERWDFTVTVLQALQAACQRERSADTDGLVAV